MSNEARRTGSGGETLRRLLAPALVIAVLLGFFALVAADRPARPEATAGLGTLADPNEVYDPVTAGEPLPEGFRQVVPRDAILPIYDPQFVAASATTWSDDTLVMGVALDGEAKAYPVSLLNRREMVVDSLAGIPILVTW